MSESSSTEGKRRLSPGLRPGGFGFRLILAVVGIALLGAIISIAVWLALPNGRSSNDDTGTSAPAIHPTGRSWHPELRL
jgi:hypothetical protein